MANRLLAPKQMRTLQALEATNSAEPLTEMGVWRVAKDPDGTGESFHGALARLVELGYAIRTGRRGGYEWYITPAGAAVLPGKENQ